jgi:WD40 repeat protein
MDMAELLKRFEPQEVTSVEYHRQLWNARFSPCGDYLIAGGYDATIQRWKIEALPDEPPAEEGKKKPNAKELAKQLAAREAQAFQPMTEFKGHDGWVQCLEMVSKDQRVLTADSWGRVSCWHYADDKSTKPIWTVEHALQGWVRAMAVSPDENFVAIGGNDRVIRILKVADGSVVSEIPVKSNVYSLAYHPQESFLLAGNLIGEVQQWDVKEAAAKLVRTFDAAALYQVNHMQECGGVRCISFDSDGSRFLCGGQKQPGGGFAKGAPGVLMFDWKTAKSTEFIAGAADDGFLYDAQFHAAGFFMGCASAFPGKGKLFFWQPGDAKSFFVGTKLTNGRSVSLHPDGKRIAYLTADSRNANGRPLKDGKYIGGSAVIRILKFPDLVEAKA